VNWIDLTLLAVLLVFGLRGYFRGLFREVCSLLGLLAGLVGAARYAEPVAHYVDSLWSAPPIVLKALAFTICFFVIYVSFNWAGWLLHRSAKVWFLSTVNRLGGILLGVGKGMALAALVVFALTSTTLMPRSARAQLEDAYLVAPLSRLADTLIRFGKDKVFAKEGGQFRLIQTARRAKSET
jgi:membrane protein required for colicin V production